MTQERPGIRVYPQLHDREWLIRKHHEEGLEAGEIAELLGCWPAAARNALIGQGLYRPKRRSKEMRVLGHITAERLIEDAKKASSWWSLAQQYHVQRCIVQDHAIYIGVFDEIPQYFNPRNKRSVRELEPHPQLESRDWIASVFGERYQLKDVADEAGVTKAILDRWLRFHRMSGGEMRDARNRAICLEYEDGAMLKELSVRFDIDQAGIYRILVRGGCDTSRRKGSGGPHRRSWRERTAG